MRASSSGPVGALLMIAPLVAIPIVAIVGIPQFAPVVASSDTTSNFGEEPFVERDDSSNAPFFAPRSAASTTRGADDLFAPLSAEAPRAAAPVTNSYAVINESRQRNSVAPTARHQSDSADFDRPPVAGQTAAWTPPSGALDGWDVETVAFDTNRSSREPQTSSPTTGFRKDLLNSPRPAPAIPSSSRSPIVERKIPDIPLRAATQPPAAHVNRENSQHVVNQSTTDDFSWDRATQRLRALGIRKHQLEWLAEANSFLFTCTFTPPHSPRVTHRFEAEADEPLHAVQKVLEQIDSWQAQR